MKKSIQVNQISIQRIYTIGILIVAAITLNSCQDNEPTEAISSPPPKL